MYVRRVNSHTPAIETPRHFLPGELVLSMEKELPSLAEETVRAVRARIPALVPALEDPCRAQIQAGVERALREFLNRLSGGPARLGEETADDCRELGRNEMRRGGNLEALQAAFRLAARLAWRRCIDTGSRMGIEPGLLYPVAESLFAYIDELAAHCAEGFSQAQLHAAGELRLRRQRLLQILTADTPAPLQTVTELALAAAWRLPQTVQVVAFSPARHGRRTAAPAPVLESVDALADFSGPDPLLLIPEPGPQHRPALEKYLDGRAAVVGPPVALEHAAVSLRWARRLLALGARGLGGTDTVMYCADNLMPLMLLQDEVLIRTLTARRLAPLAHLTPKQHERVTRTLLAWLQCSGNTIEAARKISVHPQTVRYRLRQIEDLFGSALRDPDVRFELEVVLRAQELFAAMEARRRRGTPRAARPRTASRYQMRDQSRP
ncbi:helix-turn-helix domain-containing protein [Streptomyces actinomycinicus]|uniref:Helix-turn-helix domain-containing protein n=1 Tax=Streptomyces actinomycinicus TaxID=1695166 RepID=A0A937ET06_9ACTN|nr:helix-turn-helix domain-containing protein [Streptomyces actinomycinicus]MBL1087560.1 helix-turn-helix domain-containing protein [Streptomyces actinomycinicus]